MTMAGHQPVRETVVNPALWEALIAERVRDRLAYADSWRRGRQARRGRRGPAEDRIRVEEGQPGCPQAPRLRSA